MHGINHVYRRNAVYVWRRRLPQGLNPQKSIQVSLKSREVSTIRRLVPVVNFHFTACIIGMRNGRITRAEAQEFLATIVSKELNRIEEDLYYEREAANSDEWQERYLDERCQAKAARIVAQRGLAAELLDFDIDDLLLQGASLEEIEGVERHIQSIKRSMKDESFNKESAELAAEILGRRSCDHADLRALAALRLNARSVAIENADRLKQTNLSLIETMIASTRSAGDQTTSNAKPIAAQNTTIPSPIAKRYSDDLQSVIDDYLKSVDRKPKNEADTKRIQKDLRQKRSVLNQFAEAVEVKKLSDLSQEDMWHYVEMLGMIPKHHGKCSADRQRSVREIVERGEELPEHLIGLSSSTINRNITIINGLLKFARSRGQKPSSVLYLSDLRKSDDRDERSARLAFSDCDLRALSRHPVWAKSACWNNREQNPGLYWAPIIADLSGARREEILGLRLDDIALDHEIPHILIRPNVNRGLKNASSERVVPIHSALIKLGLDDYVLKLRKIGESDLFPSFRPTSVTGCFGDQFYKLWKPILDQQLGSRSEKRTFHSFRHRAITILRHDPSIPAELVKDLVGHQHQGETDRRYRKTEGYRSVMLSNLKTVIEKLPSAHWLEV